MVGTYAAYPGQVQFYIVLVARLMLALVLGGIIGYERESMHRPAGFRTHILVCMGSALVMVTSEFIFREYRGLTNLDPARLGAQVISGIGFLGAGTIIREGFSVRGLTTAASLWAVSCVGIAAGIGFYEGAVSASILIYLTLITLKRMEIHFSNKNPYKQFYIHLDNIPGKLSDIGTLLEKYGVPIKNIEFIADDMDKNAILKLLVKIPPQIKKEHIMLELHTIEGVRKVYEE